MKKCNFEEIKDDILNQMKNQSLFPVFGSGFSVNSPASNGVVPTGAQMKEVMIREISAAMQDNSDWHEKKNFAQISSYYNKRVSKEKQKKYLKDNFTGVKLSERCSKVLDINWLYVYTINIDDAIENSSRYKEIISINRDVDFDAVKGDNVVVKMHGDVWEHLKYSDANIVFNEKEYAESINKNQSVLNKLNHDFQYNNIIYIGCSLENEFDLMSLKKIEDNRKSDASIKNSIYYFTIRDLSNFEMLDLENYGITHIVKFETYDEIYDKLTSAYDSSLELTSDEIIQYRVSNINELSKDYNTNKDYLFYSKKLFNPKESKLTLPAFFVERELVDKIETSLCKYPIQILSGRRVSGKTYCLAGLTKRVRSRSVYYFDSSTSVTKLVIDKLFDYTNTLFVFDTHALNTSEIFYIFERYIQVVEQKNNVVIACNSYDSDVISIIRSKYDEKIFIHELRNQFSEKEVSKVNYLLNQSTFPTFYKKRSILDSLIEFERKFTSGGRFSKIEPHSKNMGHIMILILLATKEKLYTSDLDKFGIMQECIEQYKHTNPLICQEDTFLFEKDIRNSSNYKFILNAKYWLLHSLGKIGTIPKNKELIIEAYVKIVQILLEERKNRKFYDVLDMIKYDVINAIFINDHKGSIGLIKGIYEKLEPLLASDPHYYHQRAKCLLWQSEYKETSLIQLKEAIRYAKTAEHNMSVWYEGSQNEKLLISIEHISFTRALIISRIYSITDNEDDLNNAITAVYEAIKFPSNLKEFKSMKKERTKKRDDIRKIIEGAGAQSGRFCDDIKKKIEFILNNYLEL